MPRQSVPVRNGYVKHRPKTERRTWVRFRNDEEVWCQPIGLSETAWLGKVRDISIAGIGLSMTRRFEPGTALIIEISERILLRAHVIHATPETEGRWIIGCIFDSVLSEQELRAFLADDGSTAQ
jgi:PilZ domain